MSVQPGWVYVEYVLALRPLIQERRDPVNHRETFAVTFQDFLGGSLEASPFPPVCRVPIRAPSPHEEARLSKDFLWSEQLDFFHI